MSETTKENLPQCAKCSVPYREKICLTPDGRGPEHCPTLQNRQAVEHARAYTTVLAAKDRVTGYNPLAAIYTLGSYSERFLKYE
jgi:hypothetical protein